MDRVAVLDKGETGQGKRLAEAIRDSGIGASLLRGPFHTGPEALAAILRNIDAIVLPRVLSVAAADGDVARLLVCNRRLMQVCAGSDPNEPAIAPSDPEIAAREFAAALGQGLASPGPFRLRRARSGQDEALQGVGCSANQLAEALPPLPVLRSADTRFGRFADLLEPDALALVRLGMRGEVVTRRTTKQTAPLIAALLLARAPNGAPNSAGPGPAPEPEFTLLEGPEGLDLIEAGDGDQRLICLSPLRARDRIIAAWTACYRRG